MTTAREIKKGVWTYSAPTLPDLTTRVVLGGCTEDGATLTCTLAELFDAPGAFSPEEQAEVIATLKRGETYKGGGGAEPLFTIELE